MSYLNILPLPDGFDKNLSLINDDCLYDIADSIRRLIGTEDTYKPPQMPNAIRSIVFSNFTENELGGGGLIRKYNENEDYSHSFYFPIIAVAVGPEVTSMDDMNEFFGSWNLSSHFGNHFKNAVCGPNVITMNNTYEDCWGLTCSPICGPKVISMFQTYSNCTNLTGSPVCGPNVVDFFRTYYLCKNLTGSPVCGPNVVNMHETYYQCNNITGSPVCGPNVTDMANTYMFCDNLTGSPACGPNVVNMHMSYSSCNNLTGSPVCGDNVVNMHDTYGGCKNLTGAPVCGPNVVDMSAAYSYCANLTGSPICGEKVTSMSSAYVGCVNIHGSILIHGNVLGISGAFRNCYNLGGALLRSDQTKLNNMTMLGAFDCSGSVQRQVRLNVILNNYQLYKNARANTSIWGCTLTADAQAELLVNLPQAYPNGVIYSNSQYQTVRGCYNAAQNLYVYCME